jgi:hypothetical protein
MAKKTETESTITISKNPAYDKHKLRTEGLDIDRVIKFNKFEKIEVTQKELDAIGLHRWLIVEEIKEGEKNE